MLELVVLYFVYRKFSRVARAKGRSGAWGWFGVGMWISAEFVGIGLIDPLFFEPLTDPMVVLRLTAVGLGFGLVGLSAAWLVLRNLEPLQRANPAVDPASGPGSGRVHVARRADVPVPAPAPPAPMPLVPAGSPAPSGSTFVGWCDECNENVWLTEDQACPVHGPDTVSGIRRPL
ncbi:MAG: hypothetical protein JXE06_05405 [Coriobacteriia bacterium]|nr:hypothetical protein [Coriobacteriia bacterium]MBN2823573.1 hypothetical protein [Coriobacteriia bacterium]